MLFSSSSHFVYILLSRFCSVAKHCCTSWITLEQGKTTADAMGDVWRGLEVVEAATRVGTEMLVSVDNREFELRRCPK